MSLPVPSFISGHDLAKGRAIPLLIMKGRAFCSMLTGSCLASQNLSFSIRISQVHPQDGAQLVGGAPCVSSGDKCPLLFGGGPDFHRPPIRPPPSQPRSSAWALRDLGEVLITLHCCFLPGETGRWYSLHLRRGTEGPRRTGETAASPSIGESGGDTQRQSVVSETLHPRGGYRGENWCSGRSCVVVACARSSRQQ